MKTTKTTTPLPILRIGVNTTENSRFLRATHGELRRGWSRDCDYRAFFAPETFYAEYRRNRGDGGPIFRLYLLRTDPNTLSVVSVVPGTGTITIPEHCAVLDDFRSSVLAMPLTRHFPSAIVEPVPQSYDLSLSEPWASPPPEVLKVMERWTLLVNNGAGFHPFDPFAWEHLIVALHMTRRSINFQWLVDWFRLNHLMPQAALGALENDFVSFLRLLRSHDEYLHLKREVELKRAGAPGGAVMAINDQPSTIN